MNSAQTRDYLEKIRFTGFQERIKPAIKKDPFLRIKLTPLYKKLRDEISFQDNLITKIKNKLGPYLLLVWRALGSPWEQEYHKRKYNISSIDYLKQGENYRFIIVFRSPSPSTYGSQYKILKRLDELKVPTVAITRERTMRAYRSQLKKLQHCKILFLDDEAKRLNFRTYLNLNKKSKERADKILSEIKDELILNALKLHRDFLELNLKTCDVLYGVYKRLFSKVKPTAIIANGFEGALLEALKEENIQKIALQHGAISDKEDYGIAKEEDELIIWGNFWRNFGQRLVSPHTKLIALGCPRFDDIVVWKRKPREKSFYNKLGLNPESKTVVFFSASHGPEVSESFYKRVIRGIGNLKITMGDKLNLIIRLHPGGETTSLYSQVFSREMMRKMVFLKKERPLYEILRHCDAAISVSSTTLLEAMAFGIPAIQFNPDKNLGAMEFSNYGGGLLIREPGVLVKEVEKLMSSDEYRENVVRQQNKFLEDALINLGRATEKIVKHLLENTNQR